jgi:HlyD family secretion protein
VIHLLRHFRNPRLLAAAALVALLLAVALWPETVPADTAAVIRGPMEVTIDEEGETRIRERFVVSAPVNGRVLRVDLEAGDRVARGDVLATFLPAAPALLDARSRAEARAAVGSAEAALGRAQAELERAEAAAVLARSEAARHRELARQQIVSAGLLEAREAELRAAEEALRAARFAVAGATHARAMARARLDPPERAGGAITITAPVDGVVLRRLRESEAVVAAGEPLLEVGDPRDLEIVSDLLSTDAVKVRPGNPVRVEQWGGDRTLSGSVRRVEPSGFMKVSALGVEEQRVNVVIDFADREEAWKALGDGYRVEVRIVVWRTADALKVPTTSLFRRGGAWAVFVVEGGRARTRTVEIGRRNGLEAEVTSGLSAGETVIVHPSDRIEDGLRVEARAGGA